jgi:hypothetical protein
MTVKKVKKNKFPHKKAPVNRKAFKPGPIQRLPMTMNGDGVYCISFSGRWEFEDKEKIRDYFQNKSKQMAKIDPESIMQITFQYYDDGAASTFRSGQFTKVGDEIKLPNMDSAKYDTLEEEIFPVIQIALKFTSK